MDRAVAALARRQHGVVTVEQLSEAGIGKRAIAGRVRRGTLRRAHRGIYVVENRPFTPYMAAVLACGEAALLSHRAAAHVWGILENATRPVDVTVTDGHRRNRPGIRVHHTTAQRARRHGIRVTTAQRTLEDLETQLTEDEYERALNEARILRLPLPASSSPPKEMTRSQAERRLLALVAAAGLPRPKANVRVEGHEVDLYWPDHHLIVEFDGWATHSGRAAFERDRRRDADLQLAGNRVLRVTHRQLTRDAYGLVARLATGLSAIRPGPGPLVN